MRYNKLLGMTRTPEGDRPYKIESSIVGKKQSKERLPGTPTRSIQGASILHTPGADVDMRRVEERQVVEHSSEWIRLHNELERLGVEQNGHELALLKFAEDNPWFRGVSIEGDYRNPISFPETTTYDRNGLIEGLGDYYRDAVDEVAELTAVVPRGVDPVIFFRALEIVLKYYGVTEEDVPKRLSMTLKVIARENIIRELREKGVANISEDAIHVKKDKPKMAKPTIYEKEKPQQETLGE